MGSDMVIKGREMGITPILFSCAGIFCSSVFVISETSYKRKGYYNIDGPGLQWNYILFSVLSYDKSEKSQRAQQNDKKK